MFDWGNSAISQGSETVSRFDTVQQQSVPWVSNREEALKVVNDDDCAICAAAARQIYEGESTFFDSMEDALRQKSFTIVRKEFFDGKLDEGHTTETHPPMGSIIYRHSARSCATMLLVFRGSTTEYDWVANMDAPPIPSPLWHNEWPHIKVHKGWVGEIWRYFSDHCGIGDDGNSPRERMDGGDRVPDLLKNYNVTKILFSGHSLGGALAQIASLGGMLMVRKMRERDREIPEAELRTFTFAAPMPFYFKNEELTEREQHALDEARRTTFNLVFDLDVVPHIPGHHEWIRKLAPDLREAAENAVKCYIPSVILCFTNAYVQWGTEKIAQKSVAKARHFEKYKHISTIVHFDLNNAESLSGFTAFSVKIMTPEEFERLEYPFSTPKDGCFKALLGLPAHSCLPQTIFWGSFRRFHFAPHSRPLRHTDDIRINDEHKDNDTNEEVEIEEPIMFTTHQRQNNHTRSSTAVPRPDGNSHGQTATTGTSRFSHSAQEQNTSRWGVSRHLSCGKIMFAFILAVGLIILHLVCLTGTNHAVSTSPIENTAPQGGALPELTNDTREQDEAAEGGQREEAFRSGEIGGVAEDEKDAQAVSGSQTNNAAPAGGDLSKLAQDMGEETAEGARQEQTPPFGETGDVAAKEDAQAVSNSRTENAAMQDMQEKEETAEGGRQGQVSPSSETGDVSEEKETQHDTHSSVAASPQAASNERRCEKKSFISVGGDSGEYEGEVDNLGRIDGFGTVRWSNGEVYEGYWRNNMMDGRGKLTSPGGEVYDGEWKNHKVEGWGKLTLASGNVYDGEWKNNKMEGRGKLTGRNGAVYEGEWKDGKREGRGKLTSPGGNVYDGEWKNGKREGRGKYKWRNGSVYEGEWKDGKREGYGKYSRPDGYEYEGMWKNDEEFASEAEIGQALLDKLIGRDA